MVVGVDEDESVDESIDESTILKVFSTSMYYKIYLFL
jgi:hypothetical protein